MIRSATLTALFLGLLAPAASAHIQVRPSTAAPDDAVLFEVLVPNEDDRATTKVELAVPPGTIPFSYEDTPGWRRSLTQKTDQSVRSIVWSGSLRPEGFVRFSFLASTPSAQGKIAWKAIQTYAGGSKVRWIGPASSDNPAAVTTVSSSAPEQNAGGEGTEGSAAPEQTDAPSDSEADDGDGSDSTARWLAAAALVVALASIALVFTRRRSRPPS